MICAKKCPAVTAGLMGLLSLPQTAYGATMLGMSEEVFMNTVPPFLFGALAGAGLAAGIVHAFMGARLARVESELAMQRIELSAQAQALSQATQVERPAAPAAPAAPSAQDKRFKARQVEDVIPAEYTGNVRSPKHVRMDWEHTGNIRVANVVDDSTAQEFEAKEMATSEREAAEKRNFARFEHVFDEPEFVGCAYTADEHEIEFESEYTSIPSAPARESAPAPTASQDYADVAENYVERKSIMERMAIRAQGVARVLQERIGTSLMGGVPIIRRADGSTGDVGTVWWDAVAGGDSASMPKMADLFAENSALVNQDEHAVQVPDSPAFVESTELPTTGDIANADSAAKQTSTQERSMAIAQRIARVEETLYPEIREIDDVKAEDDAWEAALNALEINTALNIHAAGVSVFEDDLGGADTLEEPVGLEGETEFLPFKMVANHPEVDSMESYVDYLLADELANNSSDYMKSKSPSYLRVLEGGSQQMPRLSETGSVLSASMSLPIIEGGSQQMPALSASQQMPVAPVARGKHFRHMDFDWDAAKEA